MTTSRRKTQPEKVIGHEFEEVSGADVIADCGVVKLSVTNVMIAPILVLLLACALHECILQTIYEYSEKYVGSVHAHFFVLNFQSMSRFLYRQAMTCELAIPVKFSPFRRHI